MSFARRTSALLAAAALAAGCGGDEEPAGPNVIVPPGTAVGTAGGAAPAPPARSAATTARSTAAAPTAGAAADPRAPTRTQLRAGRVLFPFAGTTAPTALLKRIRRGHAAGVILLGRNVGSRAEVRALTRSLRRAAREGGQPPPIIAVDQEGGPVKRLPGAPRRGARRMRSAAAARAEGRATARTLRAAGVNVDLAPVADVLRPGSAMEREGRGFSRRASVVAERAAAFADGLRAGGVAATAKHFPGFGAATGNTDDAPQRIGLSRAVLRRTDMAVFARVRTPLVMLSSAVYPALDDEPAVLSRAVVTGELRRRLGFRGVTVSDDLETPALAGRDAPRAAARAGVDLLLFARTYRAAARAAGRVPADAEAHARIAALRRGLR